MLDFNEFKKQKSSMAENLQKLNDEKQNSFGRDIWYPTVDAQGNAYAIIRFLPQKATDKSPIQRIWKHKAPNGKSILCPSTFGTMRDCPLCQKAVVEYNNLKGQGIERPIVPSYRKGTSLINILIIKDINCPENNGQVKKYYLPYAVEQKVNDKLFPPKDKNGNLLRNPEMVCDLWEGKNFIVEVRKGRNGFNDYSSSSWADEKSPIANTDEEIEAIYNKIFDLEPQNPNNADTIVQDYNNLCDLNLTKMEDDNKKPFNVVFTPAETTQKPSPTFVAKQIEKKEEENFSMASIENSSEVSTEDDEDLPWD